MERGAVEAGARLHIQARDGKGTEMMDKEFEVLAETIAKLVPEKGYDSHEIAGIVADSLSRSNPAFDRERFLAASRHADQLDTPGL